MMLDTSRPDADPGRGQERSRFRPMLVRILVALVLLGLLAGCVEWLEPIFPGLIPSAVVEPTPDVTLLTPSPAVTISPAPLPTIGGPVTLTVWVPPQFDPDGDTPAGDLLKARLSSFMEDNPGVLVNVRIKAASGPGGLLESLTAASAAAPGAMPALVAFSRSDLEAAALKGLVFPVEGFSQELEGSDWYLYARQLASVDDIPFGLPFAGDALMVFYRPSAFGGLTPSTWETILSHGTPMILPLDDPQAMVTLSLYRSKGGIVQDVQGRPSLQAEMLADVLALYQDGSRSGTFPTSLAQYQTGGQTWQAYRENQADWVVSWSSYFLSDLPADSSAALLPSLGSDAYTQATGWAWALSDPDLQRRELSVALAEYLVDPAFLGRWNAAAGYLPTRSGALAGWSNQSMQSLINQVVLSAQLRPPNEILVSLGPILREAGLSVLRDQVDPAVAAQVAVEKLGGP